MCLHLWPKNFLPASLSDLSKLPRTIINEADVIFDYADEIEDTLNEIDIDSFQERKFSETPKSLKTVVVKVSEGEVQGTQRQTPSGSTFTQYPGIPYAEPPVGRLRLQRPVRKRAWEGVLEGRAQSQFRIFSTPLLCFKTVHW